MTHNHAYLVNMKLKSMNFLNNLFWLTSSDSCHDRMLESQNIPLTCYMPTLFFRISKISEYIGAMQVKTGLNLPT